MSLLTKRELIALEILKPLLANNDVKAIANAFELADAFMQVSTTTAKDNASPVVVTAMSAPMVSSALDAQSHSAQVAHAAAAKPAATLQQPATQNTAYNFQVFNHDHPKTQQR